MKLKNKIDCIHFTHQSPQYIKHMWYNVLYTRKFIHAINKLYIGNIEEPKILHEILQFNIKTNEYPTIDYLASCNFVYLPLIKWLHQNRVGGCTTNAMNWAAMNGALEFVKWLRYNRTEGCTTRAMNLAAEYGHLDVVQWLHKNRTEGCTTNAMDCAAMNGHLNVVQWLHENRTEGCTTAAMNWAAENGHLSVVQWLHENRTEGCTTNAMDYAAHNGHLHVIQWLHIHRTEGCTINAMDYAARNGHLNVVQWLHINRTEGCTYIAIEYAAQNKHFDIVEWLCINGKHFNVIALHWVIINGRLDILKCLSGYCNMNMNAHSLFYYSIRNNQMSIFQWLYKKYHQSVSTDELIKLATLENKPVFIDWMKEYNTSYLHRIMKCVVDWIIP